MPAKLLKLRGECVGKWKVGSGQGQWGWDLMAEPWGSCGQGGTGISECLGASGARAMG